MLLQAPLEAFWKLLTNLFLGCCQSLFICLFVYKVFYWVFSWHAKTAHIRSMQFDKFWHIYTCKTKIKTMPLCSSHFCPFLSSPLIICFLSLYISVHFREIYIVYMDSNSTYSFFKNYCKNIWHRILPF